MTRLKEHRAFSVVVVFLFAVVIGAMVGVALRLDGEPAEANLPTSQSSAAATPTPAIPGAPDDSTPTPRREAEIAFEPREELAGATVLVLGTTYAFSPDSPDHNNGETLFSEKWVRLDADGRPIESFGRYTTEDGTVVQTVHQTPEGLDVRFLEPAQELPDGSALCGIVSSTSPEQMLAHMPPFTSASAVLEAGYAVGGDDRDLPTHPGPSVTPGAPPIRSYPGTTNAEVFSTDGSLPDGRSRVRTVVIDPLSGLLLEATSLVSLPSSEVDQESVLSVSRVDVYESGDIPDSVFDRDDLPGGEC